MSYDVAQDPPRTMDFLRDFVLLIFSDTECAIVAFLLCFTQPRFSNVISGMSVQYIRSQVASWLEEVHSQASACPEDDLLLHDETFDRNSSSKYLGITSDTSSDDIAGVSRSMDGSIKPCLAWLTPQPLWCTRWSTNIKRKHQKSRSRLFFSTSASRFR